MIDQKQKQNKIELPNKRVVTETNPSATWTEVKEKEPAIKYEYEEEESAAVGEEEDEEDDVSAAVGEEEASEEVVEEEEAKQVVLLEQQQKEEEMKSLSDWRTAPDKWGK